MVAPHLVRIAYASALDDELPPPALDALLSSWRRRNAQRGITGVLLHCAGSIFQLFEGFPDVVPAVYEAIARDPRHRSIAKLLDEPVGGREFGDWSMGYRRLSAADLGAAPGLAAFGDPAFRFWHGDEAMARALIAAFGAGPWRRWIA